MNTIDTHHNNKFSKIARRDRFFSTVIAFAICAPILFIIIICIYVLFILVESEMRFILDEINFFNFIFLLALSFVFVIVWTFEYIRSKFTAKRFKALWLRPFGIEEGFFQTSRIIDKMHRYGISTITLQDVDMPLSLEQLISKRTKKFWLIFIIILISLFTAGPLYLEYYLNEHYDTTNYSILNIYSNYKNLDDSNIFGFVGKLIFIFAFLAITIIFIMAILIANIISLAYSILSFYFDKNKIIKNDDYDELSNIIKKIHRKRLQGSTVIRISDNNWRNAVSMMIKAADVILIDITNVTENVAWEISEAVSPEFNSVLVFICRSESGLLGRVPKDSRSRLKKIISDTSIPVVFYPSNRNLNPRDFTILLRETIYDELSRRK